MNQNLSNRTGLEYWPHSREEAESKQGFGSVTNDLTKEGVLDALAKAKRNRVYDPDFKTLPEPVDKPALTNYHDKRVMADQRKRRC